MPIFFLISGYLIGWKYLDRKEPFDASRFLRSKVQRIAIPFFAWNAIYILLLTGLDVGALLSWKDLWTFTTGWNHLYYLFVLLQLFAIYVLFFSRKGSSRTQTIFSVVAVVLTLLFNVISELVYLKYGADKHHFEWTYGKVFAAWIGFFAWGIIIGARPTLAEWLRKRLWLLLAVSIAVFIVYYYQISNRPTHHLPAELGWCKDLHFRSSQAYLPYTLRLTGSIFVLSIVSKRRGGD